MSRYAVLTRFLVNQPEDKHDARIFFHDSEKIMGRRFRLAS
jgi:hypothetical protein